MRKKLIILLVSLMLVGCANERTVDRATTTYFVKVSNEAFGSIVYDSRTGVEYWRSEGSHNFGTLTMLYDSDGKPLVYKETK
jgi:hypothetical protein